MATFGQIAEQVQRHGGGGDVTADTDIRSEEVMLRAAQIVPSLGQLAYERGKRSGWSRGPDGTFYMTFPSLSIDTDKEAGLKFVPLPGKPSTIQGKGRPQVEFMTDRQTPLVVVDPGQAGMFQSLGIGKIDSAVPCWFEQRCGENRIYFDECLPEKTDKVRVRMIPLLDLAAIGPDDQVPIPAALEDLLLKELVSYFHPQALQQEDDTRDNKS